MIAILGKNPVNETLYSECGAAGHSTIVIEDIAAIKSVAGSKGAFKIMSAAGIAEVDYIIVTEKAPRNWEGISDALALSDDAEIGRIAYGDLPVVFVMDYPYDTSAQAAREALQKALSLARKKIKVVYVAKNVRPAGEGMESLYRQARQAGVRFYKYDRIAIDYTESGAFRFTLGDREEAMEMHAKTTVFDGKRDNQNYARLLKLLHVRTDPYGECSAGYFVFPSLTSRSGVFFINPYAASGSREELLAQIRFILAEIRRDMWNAAAAPALREAMMNPDGYAEVDAEKCAFCYTCYRACPHAAMTPYHEKSAMKNINDSCMGCGVCYAVCPANAITMKGRKEIKKADAPESVHIFCCKNSGELALKKIEERLKSQEIKVSITPVCCGGEVSVDAILNALKKAYRVIVAVCMDDACRHFDGNRRARREAERARELLKASGADESRVVFLQLSHAMPRVLEETVTEAAQGALEGIGL
jgi:coenzyme F420-reducing hydrogenase delta subunit/Pyruvate/2-oxoacid:ferredoxin oxidoreductase delta subunit